MAVDSPSWIVRSVSRAEGSGRCGPNRALGSAVQKSPRIRGFLWNGTVPLDAAARNGLILRRIDRLE